MRAFFDTLEEVPVHADEQKSLTRDTTDEELQLIATRAEEAAAAAAAGVFGFTVEEAEAAEAATLPSAQSSLARKSLPVLKPSRARPARKSPSPQKACRRRSPRPRQEGVFAGWRT